MSAVCATVIQYKPVTSSSVMSFARCMCKMCVYSALVTHRYTRSHHRALQTCFCSSSCDSVRSSARACCVCSSHTSLCSGSRCNCSDSSVRYIHNLKAKHKTMESLKWRLKRNKSKERWHCTKIIVFLHTFVLFSHTNI